MKVIFTATSRWIVQLTVLLSAVFSCKTHGQSLPPQNAPLPAPNCVMAPYPHSRALGVTVQSSPPWNPSDPCTDPAAAVNGTQCWYSVFLPPPAPLSPEQYVRGFPMNLSLAFGPAAPDYPPLSTNVADSTSALVPSQGGYFRGPISYPTRSTVGGNLDAITAAPLLREVDLELPFGGAMFRHVRTYSEPPTGQFHESEFGKHSGPATTHGPATAPACAEPPISFPPNLPLLARSQSRVAEELYWDWHGQGWMMGENPAFLFDAHYDIVVKKQVAETETPPRCYFLIDAHQSIPFERTTQLIDGRPVYAAPPQFDASMHVLDGEWNSTEQVWTRFPTRVDVWTHKHTVKYEVLIGHGDAPWITRSRGAFQYRVPLTPLLGLVQEMKDRTGNRVVMDYLEVGRFQANPTVPPNLQDCLECHQSCHRRGTLRSVRLYPAGNATPAWTVLYIYREFADNRWAPPNSAPGYIDGNSNDYVYPEYSTSLKSHRQLAIHGIYAFEGNVTGPSDPIIPAAVLDSLPHVGETLADHELLRRLEDNSLRGAAWFGLPANWVYECRYLYGWQSGIAQHDTQISVDPRNRGAGAWSNIRGDTRADSTPRLIKASVTRREKSVSDDGDPNSPTWQQSPERNSIYRYGGFKCHNGEGEYDSFFLAQVYLPAQTDALLAFIRKHESTIFPNSPCVGLADLPSPCLNDVPVYDATWLLTVDADAELTYFDADLQAWGKRNIGSFATFENAHVDSADVPLFGFGFEGVFQPWRAAELAGYDGQELQRLLAFSTGNLAHRVVSSDKGEFRSFGISRLMVRPEGTYPVFNQVGGEDNGIDTVANCVCPQMGSPRFSRAISHFPYRYVDNASLIDQPTQWLEATTADANSVFWVIVVAQSDFKEEVVQEGDDRTIRLTETNRAIRIIRLNRAGLVLFDTTAPVEVDLVAQTVTRSMPDAGEGYEYDSAGRLVSQKSRGYVAGDSLSRPSLGAIYLYEYHTTAPGATSFAGLAVGQTPTDLASVSVKRGDSGEPYILEQFWYHAQDRSLVTKHRVFTEPITRAAVAMSAPLPSTYVDEDTNYDLDVSTGAPIVRRRETRSSPVLLDNTSDRFRAVKSESFSEVNGMLEAESRGMRRCDDATGELIDDPRNTYFQDRYTYATYLVNGEVRTSDQLLSKTVDIASAPGLVRAAGAMNVAPIGAVTNHIGFWFGGRQTPITELPDGSREYRLDRARSQERPWTEIHTYRNVWPISTGGFQPKSLVQVDKLVEGVLTETTLRSVAAFGTSGPIFSTPDGAPVLSTVRPQFDSRGRPIEAAIEANAMPVELRFQMQLDSWGNPVRTRDIHGNITRRVYTFDGLLEKTYVGTNDEHEVWGTTPPVWDPCVNGYPDNLVLTEKLYYGTGESDARQVIAARRYDKRPTNQYLLEGCPNAVANNEDEIGKLEHFGYDWRMRRVWTETYTTGDFYDPDPETPPDRPAPTPIAVTAQYLDVQGRVRFEAVYPISHIPSSSPCDPRKAAPGAPVPTASQLLACSPVSLTENVYDARGNVAEVRTYRIDGGGYVASQSRYDHENRVIWSESPDSGIQQTWYDARGDVRVVIESANGIITRRTDYTLDVMGNVITQVSRERTHDGTGSDLTDANSVADVKYSWYEYGQLIATADLGSNGTTDAWGGATAAVSRPATAPSYLAGIIQMNGLPSHARVQLFEYDEFGRQTLSVAHDGTATRTQYDDLGRVTLVIENADAQVSLSHLRRATAYQYDERGRLSQIAAVPGYNGNSINWTATDGSVQVTRLEYNASVVDDSYEPAVMSPPAFDMSRVARVLFPNPKTGQADSQRGFEYSYLPGGQLARRLDLDSYAELFYAYDSRDNLVRVRAQQHPMRSGKVTDLTTLNVYTYDTLSRLTNAWARNEAGDTVAMDGFAYDHFGNLKWEIQQHGGALSTLNGRVDYTWDFSSTRNSNRLTEIKYPDRDVSAGVSRRHVRLGYGTAGSVSDVLSRITTISDSDVLIGTPLQRGEFTYSAGGARVRTRLGAESGTVPAVAQWQAWTGTSASNGYTGLNRFGQALDLHFTNLNGAGTTLYRAQSTYDNMGNRRTSRITQANTDNTRSWKFDYDALQRLINADMGALSSGLIVDPSGGFKRTTAWNLDSLGNWTGSPTAAGRVETGVFSGSAVTTRTVTHRMAGIASPTDVNGDNIIKQLQRTNSAGGSPTSENIAYDASGNLICDEHYVYYYDAFNRLVQVNQRGGATVSADGELNDSELGPWIRHYTYDALGRLIRTQSPYPEPSFDAYVARSERYYYDGLRRIQEVHVTPTNIEQMFVMSEMTGDPSESGGPVSGESEVIESEIAAGNVTGQPPFAEQFNLGTIEPGPGMEFNTWIDREYVWGPGDRGFDELICQHTPARDNVAASVEYALHDDAGDLVALLNRANPTGHGRVAWQATYDPYGQPRVAEMPSGVTLGFAYPRIGHKGLFVERLDTTTMLGTERLVSNARLLYHARNRWLQPTLGRWTSRDPNGLGQPVQKSWAMHGLTADVSLADPDIRMSWTDGANLHQYVRGNPVMGGDAIGLESYVSNMGAMKIGVSVQASLSTNIIVSGSASTVTNAAVLGTSGISGGMSLLPGLTVAAMSSLPVSVSIATKIVIGIGLPITIVAAGSGYFAQFADRADDGGGFNLPGIGGRGWQGDSNWRRAVEAAGRPGDFDTATHGIPTFRQAQALIAESGGRVDRIEMEGHGEGSVSHHNYSHINYTTSSGHKATMRYDRELGGQ